MKLTACLSALLLVTACNSSDTNSGNPVGSAALQEQTKPASAIDSDIYAKAVAHPGRSEADTARDAGRQPAAVLAFFGIAPGMQVLDLYSGGGYYSELLAHVVGTTGSVSAHNNAAYLGFAGPEIDKRYANDRLPNVSRVTAENNELRLDANRFDAITMILTYHDIYYVDPENGWPAIDGPGLLAELHQALKPGGILGLVDHSAPAGAPSETGGTTHRIDAAIVIEQMQDAGFVLDAQSDVLRNPEDDLEKSMSDPSVRGRTDRFVLRFRKP